MQQFCVSSPGVRQKELRSSLCLPG